MSEDTIDSRYVIKLEEENKQLKEDKSLLDRMLTEVSTDIINLKKNHDKSFQGLTKIIHEQQEKLEKIEELVESIPDLTKYSIKIKKQFKEILESISMIDDSDIEEINDQIEKLTNQVHELEVRSGMKVNKIKCEGCQTFLESTYTHDFQKCGCENESFCDGGTEYQRIGGKDLNKIKVWHYARGWVKL